MPTTLPPTRSVSMTGGECAHDIRVKRLLNLLSPEHDTIWNTYSDRRQTNNLLPPPLINGNKTDYEDLSGFNLPGLEVTSHNKISAGRLNAERGMRAAASGAGSLLSVAATLGLFYSGAKTLTSVFSGSDQEDANNASAKSFALTAAAGVGTALAQENANWGIGALGMGLLGKYLDKPLGLAAFSVFDGLNAIGMGQVKLRDNKNVIDLDKSIFDLPALQKFKPYFQNYEYAVRNFWTKLTTPNGWKNIKSSEPYDLYYAAGGGLLSGGAFLGVASLFSGWMSDKVKSFLYLPYSLTSLVNLVALGRDGQVIKKRVNDYNDKKPIENWSTRTEGWAKVAASPVIALNYLMLGLKGVGFDVFGSSENIAKSLRQFGVGIAYIGFAAQSAVKLLIPDRWGPKVKNVVNVVLNPKQVVSYLMGLVDKTRPGFATSSYSKDNSDCFYPIIHSDEHADLYSRIISTKHFQNLKHRHLTGMPSEMALGRANLDRFTHSIRVGAIACIHTQKLLENNPEYSYLNSDPAFSLSLKLASLVHDTGHSQLPWSHLSETAFPMAKDANDHLSIEALNEDSTSGFHNIIVKYCQELHGEKEGEVIAKRVISNIKNILGHKPFKVECKDALGSQKTEVFKWEYKPATDMADYMRSSGSDYASSFNTDSWTKKDYENFANQRVVFREKSGILRAGYTEEGAMIAYKHLFLRLIFNAFLNSHPVTLSTEAAYKAGARQIVPKMTLERLYSLSDDQMCDLVKSFVKQCKTKSTQPIRNTFGGSEAYAGYGPKDTIYVVPNQSSSIHNPMEFHEYFNKVLKNECPEVYEKLKPMTEILNNPSMVEVFLNFDPDFDNSAKFATQSTVVNDRVANIATKPVTTSLLATKA